MNPDQLFDYITKHMSAEQALKKLLEGSLIQYEKLKFDAQENAVHPLFIISMAALDMGWDMLIEDRGEEDMRGIAVGSSDYLNQFTKNDTVKNAITKWIEVQSRDRRDKPFMINHEGKSYSLNDLKEAIASGSDEGIQLERKIVMMAIKILSNNDKTD